MQNKSDDSDIVAELIEVTHELNELIEDNNQNIKDCYKILKRIEDKVCPPKPSLLRRVITKFINMCVVL
jgi:hypothetical protein